MGAWPSTSVHRCTVLVQGAVVFRALQNKTRSDFLKIGVKWPRKMRSKFAVIMFASRMTYK